MPKTHIEKSIEINADVAKVKSIITDFNHWRHWSPWLILDPKAKVTVSENGKKQRWVGKRVGTGEMTVLEEKENVVHYDLVFFKPWKSQSKADFLLHGKGADKTLLTWTMDGSLPFFMFWMKNMMERMIGMDFDRGLLMLKQYIEKGRVEVQLEFRGESDYAGCNYVGLKNECTLDNIGEVMDKDMDTLNSWAKENREVLSMEFFTIYHKFDFNKNRIIYTAGVGVKNPQENLPSGLINGSIPATKLHTVRHTGPYELSGNAWSALMSMDQIKEIRKNKKIPPMEFYRNNPADTDPKDLITDVCMPVQ